MSSLACIIDWMYPSTWSSLTFLFHWGIKTLHNLQLKIISKSPSTRCYAFKQIFYHYCLTWEMKTIIFFFFYIESYFYIFCTFKNICITLYKVFILLFFISRQSLITCTVAVNPSWMRKFVYRFSDLEFMYFNYFFDKNVWNIYI